MAGDWRRRVCSLQSLADTSFEAVMTKGTKWLAIGAGAFVVYKVWQTMQASAKLSTSVSPAPLIGSNGQSGGLPVFRGSVPESMKTLYGIM